MKRKIVSNTIFKPKHNADKLVVTGGIVLVISVAGTRTALCYIGMCVVVTLFR